jgi:hypothetical protein
MSKVLRGGGRMAGTTESVGERAGGIEDDVRRDEGVVLLFSLWDVRVGMGDTGGV